MARHRQAANVAFVEEAEDDSGSSIEPVAGTRIYAYSEAPEPPATPSKQLPNTSKSRRGEGSNNSSDSALRSADKQREKERRVKEARRQKEKERQREEQREMERLRRAEEKRDNEIRRARKAKIAEDSSQALKKVRPQSLRHSATQPVVQQASSYRRGHVDEPSYYGIPQPATSGNRPRASTRPASYYAGQTRPPPSSHSWQQQGSMGPPPAMYGVGSFPGPPPMFPGGPPSGMHGGPPPPSPPGPSSYFDSGPSTPMHQSRDLRQRFDYRPSSAMGHQSPASRSYAQEEYFLYDDDQHHPPTRMPSRMRRQQQQQQQQQDEDRKRMPPPDFKPMKSVPQSMPRRPSTTANSSTPFQPPPRPTSRHEQSRPRPANRRSVGFTHPPGFDDDDFVGGENALFHDISPQPPTDYRRRAMSQSRRDSRGFDDEEYEIMPAPGRSSRRGSMYGSAALGSGGVSLEGDSKYLDALRYQEDVGGPPQPLTAESLRKANKRGEGVASSRSTRSSASRDESEYKRSSTTGITRSSSGGNGDDFTIKVSGPAVVRVHGAEIECEDSEITFSNAAGLGRGGSEQASTVYQLEDGRSSHRERKALPYRTRAPSQSDSQSRGYAPSHAPYEPSYYI